MHEPSHLAGISRANPDLTEKVLIKKAELTQSRLLFVVEALRSLRRDENFVNLLRAEGLNDIPRDLHERLAA